MKKNNLLRGFTLAELLVAMAIISILALGISNFNFSRLSQKQQIAIEITKIVNRIEEARNNALIGKGIGVNLISPDSWSVTLENNSSSGSLQVDYLSGALVSYDSWVSPSPFFMSNVRCEKLDGVSENVSSPVIITFTGSLGGLSGCSGDTYKKLTFDYGITGIIQNISINSLSGVIEID